MSQNAVTFATNSINSNDCIILVWTQRKIIRQWITVNNVMIYVNLHEFKHLLIFIYWTQYLFSSKIIVILANLTFIKKVSFNLRFWHRHNFWIRHLIGRNFQLFRLLNNLNIIILFLNLILSFYWLFYVLRLNLTFCNFFYYIMLSNHISLTNLLS